MNFSSAYRGSYHPAAGCFVTRVSDSTVFQISPEGFLISVLGFNRGVYEPGEAWRRSTGEEVKQFVDHVNFLVDQDPT